MEQALFGVSPCIPQKRFLARISPDMTVDRRRNETQ
jgi:hypothetical protein